MYVRITEPLCCTAEINTTLQINYIAIKKLTKDNENKTKAMGDLPN